MIDDAHVEPFARERYEADNGVGSWEHASALDRRNWLDRYRAVAELMERNQPTLPALNPS